MRHCSKKFTLGREGHLRKALMRGLCDDLIMKGSLKTTLAKAKALRTIVEPLISKAKKNTLTARRQMIAYLYTDEAVKKIMEEVGPKYKGTAGGFTRIIKLASRKSDGAEQARIELV